MVEPLDLKLTPEAMVRALAFLAGITGYTPTLCLMKGRTDDDPEERWSFGAYGPSNIEAVSPELERLGHPLLYSVEGLVVAIPQFNFVPELIGRTLALGQRGLVVLDRARGV